MKINITRRNLSVFITESASDAISQRRERYIYGDILVLLKDPVPHYIDLDSCLVSIEEMIPRHLVYGLDSIFIGNFPEFAERQINALYKDGAIYVTNDLETDEDFTEDVIHEIAHLVESTYGPVIYQDEKVAREFLGKRQKLFYILKEHGFKVSPKDFMNLDYSFDFDMFLLKQVGYEMLTQLTIGLFLTPYGATSLREYFAESFETLFIRDAKAVKELTPACYEKISDLLEI